MKKETMQRSTTRKQRAFLLCLAFFLLPLALLYAQAAQAQPALPYNQLKFPSLPEIQIPAYTRYELKNGMLIYLMENHELPLVSGSALIRTGDRLEPEDQVGLAGLAGEVMRTGGTRRHSADELNQLLEQRAAAVETGIGDVSGTASFSALSEDLPEVFSLFAEVLREPLFPQDKLDLAKTQRRGAIARRNDSPDEIAGREFQKLVYGDNSPYARLVEYATLDNIARNDLVRFYQQYFHPNNMILGIVGDFDSATMRSLIEKAFGDWKPNPKFQKPVLPAVAQAKQGRIFLVNQPQLTQSYIQLGHLGGQLNSPDYAALDVTDGVLNGFGGRLFNQIRSRQGLAYSVYAVWSPRFDYPGLFIAGGQTRSDATVPLIKALFTEIEKIRRAPITNQELAYAKDSVLNSFVFNFQSPAQMLGRLLRYEYYGYPQDFLFRYRRSVEATTTADVQRVAQTYLKPDKLVTLVVGNAAAIQPPLTSLGSNTKVTQLDITIPAPKKS